MRVTKLIREYVESSVKEMYASKIDACGEDYRKKDNEVQKKIEELLEETELRAKQIIAECGLTVDKDINNTEQNILTYYHRFGRETSLEVYSERKKIIAERDEKIKEILLTLELGGTKAELDEMLKKIKEEVVG